MADLMAADSAGGRMILDAIRQHWPWHPCAEGARDRTRLTDKAAFHAFTIEIVRRSDTAKGFEVSPRLWAGGCSYGWKTR